ncbi:MAG: hypothetical protein N3B21_10475, partial [Clostridia bacterium]|nr:hypothetical protein [Clostridia bacterium]
FSPLVNIYGAASCIRLFYPTYSRCRGDTLWCKQEAGISLTYGLTSTKQTRSSSPLYILYTRRHFIFIPLLVTGKGMRV